MSPISTPQFSGVYKFSFTPKTPYLETHPFIKDWNAIQKADLQSHIETGVFDWVLGNLVMADSDRYDPFNNPPPYEGVSINSPFNGASYLLVDDQFGNDATEFRNGGDRREASQASASIRDLPDAWINQQEAVLEQKAAARPKLEVQYDVEIPTQPDLNPFTAPHWHAPWKRLLQSIQIKGWELTSPPPVRMPKRHFTTAHGMPIGPAEMIDPA